MASLLAASLLAGCGSASPAPGADAGAGPVIIVSAKVCGTGWQHPVPGLQTLQIHNTSPHEVEVALASAYNGAVYARVEGVGPGTTRAMPVDVGSGTYTFACDGTFYGDLTGPAVHVPGHVRGGAGVLPVSWGQASKVAGQSRAYVLRGLATLQRQTTALAATIKGGNLAQARTQWLMARLTFERLGSAYGMFGAYDDEIAGLPDGLPGGVRDPHFTGFYRLEYGLWHGQSAARLTGPAQTLSVDVRSLHTGYPGLQMVPTLALSDLALRTHEVLENAVRFQLSGQDDFGSGTTLATLAAGIDATRAQLRILQPLMVGRYRDLPALYSSLEQFQRLVDAARTSHGWTPASKLSTRQRQYLNAAAGQTLELLAMVPPLFEANPND